MNSKILLSAQLTSYRPRADRSFSLSFTTGELPPERVLDIARLHNSLGVLYFEDKEVLNREELEAIERIDMDLERKSYAQRLRAVLFVFHKQNGGTEADFPDFYARIMEGIINKWKEKLED